MKLQQGGIELIDAWRNTDDQVIWIDIESTSNTDDEVLLRQFDIHALAIQDALRPRHPPKIERFKDFLFILFRGLDADTTDIEFGVIQLSLFVGERFLISRHIGSSLSANWLFEQLENEPHLMAEGTGSLAIRLSNRLARRYVEILLGLEPRLDEIEDEMFRQPDDALLSELTRYKSRLRNINRIARYHEQIAARLRSEKDQLLDDSLEHDIIDLYEQVERTQSLANLHYQIATDLTDGYLGMSSHQLNRVMQILTIITVIFVPLTFLAGIYGMNFENMPELSSRSGYFIVIGVMFVIAAVQLMYFRKKRWI
jgi:magnesium transporter